MDNLVVGLVEIYCKTPELKQISKSLGKKFRGAIQMKSTIFRRMEADMAAMAGQFGMQP